MTLLNMANPTELEGRMAYDDDGHPVGLIEGIYLDNATERPKWAAVRVDEIGALVPLEGAVATSHGLKVMFARERILDSPCRHDGLIPELDQDTEERLYRYYGQHLAGPQDRDRTLSSPGPAVDTPPAQAVADSRRQVAATTSERAADVGEVVKEKATTALNIARRESVEVVDEAQSQAREIYQAARSQVTEQAENQVQQVARGLRQMAEQVRALADGDRTGAGPLANVVGRAGHELLGAASQVEAKGVTGLVSDGGRMLKAHPAPAIIGSALALVASAKVLQTPSGTKMKESLVPQLKDEVTAAGRNVAQELKPSAERRFDQVKAVAVEATDRLSNQAQGVARDVKTTTQRSAKTVKGTARASARRVKAAAS